jgi:hypothetical protein
MHIAVGGGGLASLIIHLFIWHEILRLVRLLWHIHTFGPFIVVALGLLLVAAVVWQRRRRRGRAGSAGYSSGTGPRDW